MNKDAAIAKQELVDAEAWATIQHDYDPTGFLRHCEDHDHTFITYCVLCPEDQGNGKESDAAREARHAALVADCEDLPF